LKVSEIAARLAANFSGPDLEITSAAAIDAATPSEIAFAAKPAVLATPSQAGCLIVPANLPPESTRPPHQAWISAPDPRTAFAQVASLLHPPLLPPIGIHPSATVAPGAQIGEGSRVGPGCVIGDQVTIGRDCVLHSNVTLYPGVTLGDRVILHAGAVLGADGFGFVFHRGRYEKFPQIGRVEIGSDVEIGANSCIDRAALGVTRIGDGTKLDNMVHIGHNCQIGRHVVIAAQTGLSGGVSVGDFAVIGGQVGIGDKARIESGVVLGSGSGVLTSKIVRQSPEPYWGTPARPLREYLTQLAVLSKLPSILRRLAKLESK
jgi:UDP-3-O-[3-hydroxymyristoyl] glucosamine N-acyltransferase